MLRRPNYPGVVDDLVHPFTTTVYPSCDYSQQGNAPRDKAHYISNWFLGSDNEFAALQWPPQSADLSPAEHLWDFVEPGFGS